MTPERPEASRSEREMACNRYIPEDSGICHICKQETHDLDFSFGDWLCYPDCHRKMWDEYFEAEREIDQASRPVKEPVAWCRDCRCYTPPEDIGKRCHSGECPRTLIKRVGYICHHPECKYETIHWSLDSLKECRHEFI